MQANTIGTSRTCGHGSTYRLFPIYFSAQSNGASPFLMSFVHIWVWVKIKDLGDHRFNFIFSINHPITGVLNFDSYPFAVGSKMFKVLFLFVVKPDRLSPSFLSVFLLDETPGAPLTQPPRLTLWQFLLLMVFKP